MNTLHRSTPATNPPEFSTGGGEMGALIRDFDWAATPVGSMERWPGTLRAMVRIMLASRYPTYIAWGREYVQFYNDAYRPILGTTKHPSALGQSTPECFAEIWDLIGPMFDQVMLTGEATWREDQLLPLVRNGYAEECYFTFSYSAIPDEEGGSSGVLVTVIETTARFLSERRLRTLRELAARTGQARTTAEACAIVMATLGENTADVPFALFYLVDEAGGMARLLGATGLAPGGPASPLEVPLTHEGDSSSPWPLNEVVGGRRTVTAENLGARLAGVTSPWPELPHTACVLPVAWTGQDRVAGVLVLGASSRRACDDDYRGFFELVAGQAAAALASARAYEDERRRSEALAEIDRAKTAFFSNVSHEFRTPLTLILGPLEDALCTAPAEQREPLEVAHRNSLRLLRLVNTLLDFSRIEAGRVKADYEPTELAAFTAELASMFRSAIDQAGLRFEIQCPAATGPAFVDRDMWEKIVLNLLSNAFKFTFEGSISVSLLEMDGQFELTVRDTGTGVAAHELPRLFERFHRVEGARARTHEGSGIGLALVHELVRLHGGTIEAASAPGQGSTFTVRIPSGEAHLPKDRVRSTGVSRERLGAAPFVEEALRWLPAASGSGSPAESRLDRDKEIPQRNEGLETALARLLVADDNSDMRDYLVRLLRPRHEVEAVADGSAALAAAKRQRPDLILADVMMPELDGFGLIAAVRADPELAAVPVILLSARAGEESRVEGLDAGADDYLVKPFSARELLACVRSHVETARLRDRAATYEREQARSFQAIADERERNRRQLATILDNMAQGVAVYDRAGRVITMNPAFIAQHGLSPGRESLRHRDDMTRHFEATFPDGRPMPEADWPISRALEGETVRDQEILVTRRDTGRTWIGSYSAVPVRDSTGAIESVVLTVFDVTERKTMIEALRRSEARLNQALRASRMVAWDWDTLANVVTHSENADEVYGLEPGGLIRMAEQGFSLVHPDDLDMHRAKVERVATEGGSYVSRFRIIRPGDGGVQWMEEHASATRDSEGGGAKLSGIVMDVTERVRQEDALRTSEQRLRLALASADIGIWDWNPITGELSWDERIRAMYGVGRHDEPTYDLFLERLHPDDRERANAAVQRALDPASGGIYEVEIRIVSTGEIEERWLLSMGRVSFDAAGRATRFIGTAMDITDRKRAMEQIHRLNQSLEQRVEERTAELARSNAELETSNEQMIEFSYSVSHDLRAPIRAMRGYVDALMEDYGARLDETGRAYGRRVSDAAARMDTLINDLLNYSRLGKMELAHERVPIAGAVGQALNQLERELKERRASVSVEVEPSLSVRAHEATLVQAISNLLLNAAKFVESGVVPEIMLRAERRGWRIRLWVEDNGIGIAPEHHERIFKVFEQLHGRDLYPGTGVGLAMVKKALERMGGEVGLESQTGRGSRFWIELSSA